MSADRTRSGLCGGITSLVCLEKNIQWQADKSESSNPQSITPHKGRTKLTFCPGTHALIFVIDSCDRARMEEAKSELGRIIQDREMRNVVLLVFANKQDVDGGEYLSTRKYGKPYSNTRLTFSQQPCDQTT